MGDSEETLFNNIIGDMKNMGPLWEDLYVKASKFYGAIKQTAITADAFLESFQKVADATNNSKGSTRDIGISFGKIVFRHKQIEYKLKAYVGVLADNFLTPLQEAVDEWKKTNSLLEKDHAKDYKKVKGDLKKANADVVKLKKKASKKVGKQEYTDQFREAMRVANSICKTLEDQERSYLEKVMVEERKRAAQFFQFYKPVMDQELTLISEIEQLQSIVDETTLKCQQPTELPETAKDIIKDYKVPEYLRPGNREFNSGPSPPSSPPIVKDRSLSVSSNSSKGSLTRSATLPSNYSKGGPDPVPVNMPRLGHNSRSSSRSSFSSSSSLDHANNMPVFDPVTLEELQTPTNGHHHHRHDSLGQIDEYITNGDHSSTIHKTLKARTSWSSIETTDSSSGIGSHNSLNSHHLRSGHSSTTTLPSNYCHSNSSNESEGIEHDFPDPDHGGNYPLPPPMDFNTPMKYGNDAGKYATIDRSHFRRNQRLTSSLREQNGGIKQRSNSFGENENPFPDYKMNLPKNKMNTIARTAFPSNTNGSSNGRPTIYNLFDQQSAAELRKKLSPASSPVKATAPPLHRRNSTSNHAPPPTTPKPKSPYKRSMTLQTMRAEPKAFTEDNEPEVEDITPGSFQDELNKRRLTIRRMSATKKPEGSVGPYI